MADGDAQQDGSNLADTLLAEYVAANANLRREQQKLEKDLAAVRQAHEDLLFERQDHMESYDEDNVLRMKLELHKNQVIFIESYLPLRCFSLALLPFQNPEPDSGTFNTP